ncbi:MAG: branched-chain amino acid ABC transporter permease [Desulfurococcales archaeon]|nr:branched-chain amino acid ABC transporter permease [Desulfurococcales archaeon]
MLTLPAIIHYTGFTRLTGILTSIFILSLYSLSFSILLGYLGLLNFGHALFFGLGGYTTAYALNYMGAPYMAAILASLLVGAISGIALSFIVRRVFHGVPFAFISLAVMLIVYFLYRKRELRLLSGGEQGINLVVPGSMKAVIFSETLVILGAFVVASSVVRAVIASRPLRRGSTAFAPLALAGVVAVLLANSWYIEELSLESPALRITPNYYFLSLNLLVLSYLFTKRLVESPVGRVWLAIRENEQRASALGFDVFKYKALAMAMAGSMAALAGSLYAPFTFNINPDKAFSPLVSVYAIIYSIIGGVWTPLGPILGTGFVVFLERLLADYTGKWSTIIVGAVFIAVMYAMPRGLAGLLEKAPRLRRGR